MSAVTINHRFAPLKSIKYLDTRSPFSNFDFIEDTFGDYPAIRRLFSQARAFGSKTLVIEDIPPIGIIESENDEISRHYTDYKMRGLKRISFWKSSLTPKQLNPSAKDRGFIGYAILKQDIVPSRSIARWHVFESVLPKYPHVHNCVPAAADYPVCIGDKKFSVKGVLYCQQNGLNKACAQVALRSLCAVHIPDTEIGCSRINAIAEQVTGRFDPAEGLQVTQIRHVLKTLGIEFRDIDYTTIEDRLALPYQKYIYAGIESGAGALLGFKFTGPKAKSDDLHIIPFFGHTFNQDTWVPDADVAYFRVGENTGYVPSEAWCSSFIGHDDNFGSNFCVPRLYVKPDQAEYVVEIIAPGFRYSGVMAEAIAADYLYSILPELQSTSDRWLKRLVRYAAPERQQVVLRAIALKRAVYVDHLKGMRDWCDHAENSLICKDFRSLLPSHIWMIEISLPQLFPANARKLGEIILDASFQPPEKRDFSAFIFARVPGRFMFLEKIVKSKPQFLTVPSGLTSHTPLFHKEPIR